MDIFKEAEKHSCLNILDLISVKAAAEKFNDSSAYLFLNIFPSTLLEKDFLSWWDANIPPLKPIVLELLENEPVGNWEELKAVTKELRVRDIKIAVDDMGTGYSFFQHWIELCPDFVKLDKYFSKDLSTNFQKQKVVKSLIDLLFGTAEIIIEGIETKADLDTAELLGVPYAQGYLLGRPAPNTLK
jgi:EAL domain-containing protein (putative c-di-GMP-specific phosphodiesterase class I)